LAAEQLGARPLGFSVRALRVLQPPESRRNSSVRERIEVNGHVFSEQELEALRRRIESAEGIDVVTPEVRRLVAEHWPELLAKLPPEKKK
jgi:hypothetical protein